MLSVEVEKGLPGFCLNAAFTAGEELVVLFGPSGAGKTLTLQAIAGIVAPDRGRITLNGVTLFDSAADLNLPPQRRRVGYVPQSYALFPHLSVEENVAYGVPRGEPDGRRLVADMLALMGLEGAGHRRPRELSGGQQQRVALARALASRPRVLLLDEPFSSLDRALRDDLRREFRELHRRWEVNTLLVTHDLSDAFYLGERIVVLDGGRVLQQGAREDVFYRPATRRVAEFLGTRNIFRARVQSLDGDILYLAWHGYTLRAHPMGASPGAEVDVCVRPTQVMIVRPDRPSHLGPPENLLCGTLVDETLHAETYTLFVRLAGKGTEARVQRSEAGRPVLSASEGPPFDIEIELPGYVYHRLDLHLEKQVQLSLRPEALHLIPA